MKQIRDTGKSVNVGDVVIVAGDDADEYTEYVIKSIMGEQVQLEGLEGNFFLKRITVVCPVQKPKKKPTA